LALFLSNGQIGKRKRKEIGWSEVSGSNRKGGCGRGRAGEEICYYICRTREMGEGNVEFIEEGKVGLFSGGKGGTGLGKSSDKGFVIREEGEGTSFDEEAEMEEGKVDGQEFTVKGRVAGFGGGQFV
jgi:hypothetical protein